MKKLANATFYAVLALLLIVGLLTRIHSMDRSLWLDEAWVANSVLEPTISDTVYYRDWLQTSPPLFLLLMRFVVGILGVSNEAFRVIPALFGFFSVILMALSAARLLRPSFSLVAVSLFVFCPSVVYYSHEAKQYSTDVFVSLMLISLGLVYLSKPSKTNLYFWLGSFLLLSFVSYQAVLFIPGMCLATILAAVQRPRSSSNEKPRVGWLEPLVVVIFGSIASSINYLFFILPNKQPQLDAWFQLDSLRQAHFWSVLLFELRRLPDLASLLFLREVYWRSDLIALKSLLVLVMLVGVGGLFWSGRTSAGRVNSTIAAFLAMPIVCLFFLNALAIYPIGIARVMLYLLPCIIILFVYGLQAISVRLDSVVAKALNLGRGGHLTNPLALLSSLLLVLLFLPSNSENGLSSLIHHEPIEASEHAIRYLAERVEQSDVVYIHASMREQFKLYSHLTPVAATNLVLGNIGWPCCPRDVSLSEPKGLELEKALVEEVSRVEFRDSTTIWLLFIDHPRYWARKGRSDPEVFKRRLAKTGWFHSAVKLRGVHIDKYERNRSAPVESS
jgi:hypothetical protein